MKKMSLGHVETYFPRRATVGEQGPGDELLFPSKVGQIPFISILSRLHASKIRCQVGFVSSG